MAGANKSAEKGPVIVYDGACPLCSAYVRMARLDAAAGPVTLVDARGSHLVLDEIHAAGLDLDQGMALKLDGQLHHGAAAMVALAALTTRFGTFNRLMRLAFRNPRRARLIYPPLVAGRFLLLRLLGRPRLARAARRQPDPARLPDRFT